jgi:hypothetical protein
MSVSRVSAQELIKPRIFVLGNHYFPELGKLYDVRQAVQSEIVEIIGAFNDLGNYFNYINFQPDLLFITDESLPPLYAGLEKLEIPIVGYLIDSHLHIDWHIYFARVFDHCFVAQQNHFNEICLKCSDCSLLPLFAPGDLSLNLSRDIDICFVGTLDATKNPERVRFIDSFKRQYPLTVAQGSYQELFNRSRIILNQSVNDDINFRVFEALACGGMLLTDSVGNGLEKLFSNGKHLVIYEKGNVADAICKVKYYLANEHERQDIALAGHLETLSRHSSHSRMLVVNKVFKKLLGNYETSEVSRRLSLVKTYSALASRSAGYIGDRKLADSYNALAERLER